MPGRGPQLPFPLPLGREPLTLNMNWHHPDLYFFLCLITGLAALLAITYGLRKRKPPVILMKAMPLDGLNESGPWSKPMTAVADLALPDLLPDSRQARKQAAERFSRLCEGIKDVPPKAQASRVRDHFGIFGGVRPAQGRGRKGK